MPRFKPKVQWAGLLLTLMTFLVGYVLESVAEPGLLSLPSWISDSSTEKFKKEVFQSLGTPEEEGEEELKNGRNGAEPPPVRIYGPGFTPKGVNVQSSYDAQPHYGRQPFQQPSPRGGQASQSQEFYGGQHSQRQPFYGRQPPNGGQAPPFQHSFQGGVSLPPQQPYGGQHSQRPSGGHFPQGQVNYGPGVPYYASQLKPSNEPPHSYNQPTVPQIGAALKPPHSYNQLPTPQIGAALKPPHSYNQPTAPQIGTTYPQKYKGPFLSQRYPVSRLNSNNTTSQAHSATGLPYGNKPQEPPLKFRSLEIPPRFKPPATPPVPLDPEPPPWTYPPELLLTSSSKESPSVSTSKESKPPSANDIPVPSNPVNSHESTSTDHQDGDATGPENHLNYEPAGYVFRFPPISFQPPQIIVDSSGVMHAEPDPSSPDEDGHTMNPIGLHLAQLLPTASDALQGPPSTGYQDHVAAADRSPSVPASKTMSTPKSNRFPGMLPSLYRIHEPDSAPALSNALNPENSADFSQLDSNDLATFAMSSGVKATLPTAELSESSPPTEPSQPAAATPSKGFQPPAAATPSKGNPHPVAATFSKDNQHPAATPPPKDNRHHAAATHPKGNPPPSEAAFSKGNRHLAAAPPPNGNRHTAAATRPKGNRYPEAATRPKANRPSSAATPSKGYPPPAAALDNKGYPSKNNYPHSTKSPAIGAAPTTSAPTPKTMSTRNRFSGSLSSLYRIHKPDSAPVSSNALNPENTADSSQYSSNYRTTSALSKEIKATPPRAESSQSSPPPKPSLTSPSEGQATPTFKLLNNLDDSNPILASEKDSDMMTSSPSIPLYTIFSPITLQSPPTDQSFPLPSIPGLASKTEGKSIPKSNRFLSLLTSRSRNNSPKSDPLSRSKSRPQGPLEIAPEPLYTSVLESSADLESESWSDLEQEPSSDLEQESSSDLEPEQWFDLEPDSASDVEPSSSFDLEPDSSSDLEPEQWSDLEPDSSSDLEPEQWSDSEPDASFDLEPDSSFDLEPDSSSDLEPDLSFDLEQEPWSNLEPESSSDLEQESSSDLEPEQWSDSEPDAEPESSYTSIPRLSTTRKAKSWSSWKQKSSYDRRQKIPNDVSDIVPTVAPSSTKKLRNYVRHSVKASSVNSKPESSTDSNPNDKPHSSSVYRPTKAPQQPYGRKHSQRPSGGHFPQGEMNYGPEATHHASQLTPKPSSVISTTTAPSIRSDLIPKLSSNWKARLRPHGKSNVRPQSTEKPSPSSDQNSPSTPIKTLMSTSNKRLMPTSKRRLTSTSNQELLSILNKKLTSTPNQESSSTLSKPQSPDSIPDLSSSSTKTLSSNSIPEEISDSVTELSSDAPTTKPSFLQGNSSPNSTKWTPTAWKPKSRSRTSTSKLLADLAAKLSSESIPALSSTSTKQLVSKLAAKLSSDAIPALSSTSTKTSPKNPAPLPSASPVSNASSSSKKWTPSAWRPKSWSPSPSRLSSDSTTTLPPGPSTESPVATRKPTSEPLSASNWKQRFQKYLANSAPTVSSLSNQESPNYEINSIDLTVRSSYSTDDEADSGLNPVDISYQSVLTTPPSISNTTAPFFNYTTYFSSDSASVQDPETETHLLVTLLSSSPMASSTSLPTTPTTPTTSTSVLATVPSISSTTAPSINSTPHPLSNSVPVQDPASKTPFRVTGLSSKTVASSASLSTTPTNSTPALLPPLSTPVFSNASIPKATSAYPKLSRNYMPKKFLPVSFPTNKTEESLSDPPSQTNPSPSASTYPVFQRQSQPFGNPGAPDVDPILVSYTPASSDHYYSPSSSALSSVTFTMIIMILCRHYINTVLNGSS